MYTTVSEQECKYQSDDRESQVSVQTLPHYFQHPVGTSGVRGSALEYGWRESRLRRVVQDPRSPSTAAQRSANNAECACVPSHSAGYLSDAHRHAEERDVSVHACVLASVSVHACALRHAEQRTDVVVSCSFSVASLYD